MDSSAVMSFRKMAQLAETNGFDLVLTDAPETVRRQLDRGGVVASDGVVRFEPDLDRGLQWCEDGLLEGLEAVDSSPEVLAGLPPRMWTYFERLSLTEGTTLISQGESPDDDFVLESGRLRASW
jgi:hypothetical protein